MLAKLRPADQFRRKCHCDCHDRGRKCEYCASIDPVDCVNRRRW